MLALAILASMGPFSIDMYLPTLPSIADDLNTTAATAQLTLTGFMVGMGLGQILMGPLSDALGRRRLILGGAVVAAVAAVACATAPTIWVFVLARVLLGLGSGTCVVTSRAVVPDLVDGREAARAFSIIMLFQGLAPVLAPVLGGVLAAPLGWRGLMWLLVGFALIQLVVAYFLVPESLPQQRRTKAPLRNLGATMVWLFKKRDFVGYTIAYGFGFGGLFCYVSGSALVIQKQLGLSPVFFSAVFAVNSLGIVLGNFLNAHLVRRVYPHSLLRMGHLTMFTGGVVVLLAGLFYPTLWLLWVGMFLTVVLLPFIMGNGTALGTSAARERAGSASAVMGLSQFVVAGFGSALMGLGTNHAVVMGVGVVTCTLIGLGGVFIAGRK